jgi:hypothetical protein
LEEWAQTIENAAIKEVGCIRRSLSSERRLNLPNFDQFVNMT